MPVSPEIITIKCSPQHPEGEQDLVRFLSEAAKQTTSSACIYEKEAFAGQPFPRRSLLVIDPQSKVVAFYDVGKGGRPRPIPPDISNLFNKKAGGYE